jgi:hypothetical protein
MAHHRRFPGQLIGCASASDTWCPAAPLPAGAAYRLNQQVTSGYLHAGVAQSPSASRTISAQITSGELELVTR